MTPSAERRAEAKRIRDAALELLARVGRLTEHPNLPGPSIDAQRGPLRILMTTPNTGARGMPAPYGVDIWLDGHGKVFSVWWG